MPEDQRHDSLYGRFMEQLISKLKNSEQTGMEDSLPFPVEHLRATPTTLPSKRVSDTSSHSGSNYPHVLSPAMPVTPDSSHHPQPYLRPSTSRMSPPSGPLTPIQRFIRYSRKSQKQEPKIILFLPDHPDPQSVLRTRTRKG